jgi:hypothetical protein
VDGLRRRWLGYRLCHRAASKAMAAKSSAR